MSCLYYFLQGMFKNGLCQALFGILYQDITFFVITDICHCVSIKHEMARVNIDILGISELKWPGMGGFSSDLLLWAGIP